MFLSTEQLALLQPLLPSPPQSRGRPPLDQRLLLDAILWKFSTSTPWDLLPDFIPDAARPGRAPSHQTCYRYYRRLVSSGLFSQILHVLYLDLVERGGFDLHHAVRDGLVKFYRAGHAWKVAFSPALNGTWQLSTARIFTGLVVKQLRRIAP